LVAFEHQEFVQTVTMGYTKTVFSAQLLSPR